MKKRYVIICILLFLMVSLYINKDVYYISKWHMYVKIENADDATTIYFSNSRWSLRDNYIKYRPESAETSHLGLNPVRNTLYAVEHNMEIVDIQSKDYNIKPVRYIVNYKNGDYWTDSTFLKVNIPEWIHINHRHGVIKSWD